MDTHTTITHITEIPVESSAIFSYSIDKPHDQHTEPALNFDIAGWIIGNGSPVLSVEVIHNDFLLTRIPVSLERIDVAAHYPALEHANTSGFRGRINTLNLPKDFRVTLQAVIGGRTGSKPLRIPFAHINGIHSGLTLSYVPTHQPLLITALGRSGTTWLMRLLSGDDNIASANSYPYETRVGVYWMHMLQVLSSPGDHKQSTSPDGFETGIFSIGSCPYFHPAFLENLENGDLLHSWFSRDYVCQLADFCQRMIDQYYDLLSRKQAKEQTRFFMEKNLGGQIPWISNNIYQSPKEIILIRDFRDMFCSSKAFNEKRGYAAFGRQMANSDEQWIQNRYRGAKRLINSWKERKDTALLIRYEDLILQPEETLAGLLDYLGSDVSRERVERLISKAMQDTPELQAHRTTRDPSSSIGRWKYDMDAETRDLFTAVFGDMLSDFGYL